MVLPPKPPPTFYSLPFTSFNPIYSLKFSNMNKLKLKNVLPFLGLAVIALGAMFVPSLPNFDDGKFNGADTAWILVATALVFLMTPGLAFFYGGMVNRKNVLSTMMKSVVAAGIVGVLWIVVGFSLCFGGSLGGFIG